MSSLLPVSTKRARTANALRLAMGILSMLLLDHVVVAKGYYGGSSSYSGGSSYSSGGNSYYGGESGYNRQYGYGGGGYYGHGYYNHGQYYDDDGWVEDGGNDRSTSSSFLFFVMVLLVIFACTFGKLFSKNVNSNRQRHFSSDGTKEEELLDKEGAADPNHPTYYTMPANGTYVTSYIEPRLGGRPPKLCNGEINIRFQKRQGGWKMIGGGGDADGRFTIKDGFVALDGKAFWKEVGPGTNVSNAGDFDFKFHTFTGTWLADNGRGGEYLEFYHKTLGSPGRRNEMLHSHGVYVPPASAPVATAVPESDVEQGKAHASLVHDSTLSSQQGVYVPPAFAQAVIVPQNDEHHQQQHGASSGVAQQQVFSSTHQTIAGYGTYVPPPFGYVSSVSSSEDNAGLSSESLSSSYGYRPRRNQHPPPSAPQEQEVKKP